MQLIDVTMGKTNQQKLKSKCKIIHVLHVANMVLDVVEWWHKAPMELGLG